MDVREIEPLVTVTRVPVGGRMRKARLTTVFLLVLFSLGFLRGSK